MGNNTNAKRMQECETFTMDKKYGAAEQERYEKDAKITKKSADFLSFAMSSVYNERKQDQCQLYKEYETVRQKDWHLLFCLQRVSN